jgi:hydrogenase expression/formation protein HypD
MKFLDEYRNAKAVKHYTREVAKITSKPWMVMEVCGGQTHTILKYGIDRLLPDKITLLHGPGCPVCVTPIELIDKAIKIASQKNIIFCSFGDMLRVPGTNKDLLSVKADGGDIRIVYSPLDSLEIAKNNPSKEVVFFAIGFETTAPANAMVVHQAKLTGIHNFSVLVAQVLIPPAIEAILSSPSNNIQAFLAPGHVCTVMGFTEYERIVRRFNVPIVVTGFEPLDILQGIYMSIAQLEEGEASVENQYSRSVKPQGNIEAQKLMKKVFKVVDRRWRGFGEIRQSGLGLTEVYSEFDAEKRFDLGDYTGEDVSGCISGLILQGVKKPFDCQAFAKRCTPEHPLGATMVSSEGACAAYYYYRKTNVPKISIPKE